jgi:hypothetical protein
MEVYRDLGDSWTPHAPWETPSSSGQSATTPARAGGSSSTATTHRCYPQGTSWMQATAGIAAYLLRLVRVIRDGPNAPVVDRADQWWAVPPALRTVHTSGSEV